MPEGNLGRGRHLGATFVVTIQTDPVVVDSAVTDRHAMGRGLGPVFVIVVRYIITAGELGHRHVAAAEGHMALETGHLRGPGKTGGRAVVARPDRLPSGPGVGVTGLALTHCVTGASMVNSRRGLARGRPRMADLASATAGRQLTAAVNPLLVGEVHQGTAPLGIEGMAGPAGVVDFRIAQRQRDPRGTAGRTGVT